MISSPTHVPALTWGPEPSGLDTPDLASVLLAAAEAGTGEIRHVRDETEQRRQTYRELAEEAARVLGGMRERGAHRGDKVIIRLADEADLPTAFWACVLGGVPGGPGPL